MSKSPVRPKKNSRRPRRSGRPPGRPTVSAESLIGTRDELVGLLSVRWADIGWNLPRAKTFEELRQALEPLRGDASQYLIARFLRSTSVTATSREIRSLREVRGEAVEAVRAAQDEYDSSARDAVTSESAMNFAQGNSQAAIFPAMLKGWRGRTSAQSKLATAQAALQSVEEALADKEASFVQNELLDYIKAKKYARDPRGLAYAMAGLPDMAWETSYERCAKVKHEQWPTFPFRVFKTIQAIWNRRESYRGLTRPQLFRQEISKLPRTTIIVDPKSKESYKQDNFVRSRLADFWIYLKAGIEETANLEIHPGQVPFRILAEFTKNLGKPRTPQDLVLEQQERI